MSIGNKQKSKNSTGMNVLIASMLVVIVGLVAVIVIMSTDNTKIVDPVINDPTQISDDSTALPTGATGIPATEEGAINTETPEPTPESTVEPVTPEPTETATATPEPVEYNLVDYSGRVEHIFTHSLIAFPELAYPTDCSDVDKVKNTYFIDCITVKEFKLILEALYKDGYMLVNLNYVFEVDADGNVRLKDSFKFPEGKKPLVFSFDDTNYYSDRMGRGMIDKLILIDGKVGTYTKHKDGTVVQGFDEEYIPILDRFVEEHPDFSFNGAKGMICVTGYDGILGYRTQRITSKSNRTEEDRQREIEAVLPIIQALKDTGWYFASHSYKHGVMERYSESNMENCASKFYNEVIPLIGETQIYVYPYGSWQRSSDGKTCPAAQRVLNNYGFKYFCSVGANWYVKKRSDLGGVILQDRCNIDGTAFVWNQNIISYVSGTDTPRFPSINFREIYDEARNISYDDAVAAYKTWKGK